MSQEPDLIILLFKNLYSFNFKSAEENLSSIQAENIASDTKDICTANYHWWLLVTQAENSNDKLAMLAALDRIISRHEGTPPGDLNPDEIFALIHALAYKTRLKLHEMEYYEGAKNLNLAVKYLEIILPRAEENSKFMLLAGLYHYVAGSILEEHPLFHPLFLLAPKTEKDKGYKYLLSCTEDQNPLISNEARYFLMKVNNQINKEYFEADKIARQILLEYPDNQYYRYYRITILAELGNIEDIKIEYTRLCNFEPDEQMTDAQHSFLIEETKRYLQKKRIKIQN